MSEIRRASRPFCRAVFKDARTTDDKIPIIAMTTKSSISVKPLFLLFIFYLLIMADNHQHPTIIEPFSFTETRPGAEVNGPDLVSSQAQTFQLCVVAAFVAIPYS